MKKREERKYFDKEWKGMQDSLKAFLKKECQEDLHRFRVQVKKLRAFLILADSTDHHPKLAEHFKPVRNIFKQAGEIRNAYMNQELGRLHHTGNYAFLSSQHQLQVKAIGEFKSAGLKHTEKLKDAHKILKQKIIPINDVHINLFYQNQLQQIAGIFTSLKFNEGLHECRKKVKILIYNYKLVHTTLITGFNEAYLEQVQTAIGDWHDNVLAIELFSGDEAQDKTVVAPLKKQATKLRRNITALTKGFYDQATTVVDLPLEQLS
jgi:CHAD domain-containing protein